MEPSLLALDLASASGYSQWAPSMPKPRAGLLEIQRTSEIGPRLAQIYKWALRRTKEWAVTDISIESPILGAAGSAEQTFWLVSAYGVICMLGAQLGIKVVPIANSTWFISWVGTNNVEKKLRKAYSVLEAQRRGFPNVKDHNTADSLGVLSLRCCQLGLKTPWDSKQSPGPLFTGAHPTGTRITKDNERAASRLLNSATSFERDKT